MTKETELIEEQTNYLFNAFRDDKSTSEERLSNCCSAPIISETDICSSCHEHCEKL